MKLQTLQHSLLHRPISRRAAILLAAFGTPALSQDLSGRWPSKTLRIIVPYPAGGTPDSLARQMGEQLTASLGVPAIIENRPGASGVLGVRAMTTPSSSRSVWATWNRPGVKAPTGCAVRDRRLGEPASPVAPGVEQHGRLVLRGGARGSIRLVRAARDLQFRPGQPVHGLGVSPTRGSPLRRGRGRSGCRADRGGQGLRWALCALSSDGLNLSRPRRPIDSLRAAQQGRQIRARDGCAHRTGSAGTAPDPHGCLLGP